VREFIESDGWTVVPARQEVKHWPTNAAIPAFHCRKTGRMPRLVAVLAKKEPREYGIANQLRHGMGEDLWQGYHTAEQSAGLPLWIFIHEDKPGVLLRAKRSELAVVQQLSKEDSNGAYDEDMVFFARDSFGVFNSNSGTTGQQHFSSDDAPNGVFGEEHSKSGQKDLSTWGDR
jgi:hypothetical protein